MDVCRGFYGSWAAAMPSVLVSTSCILLFRFYSSLPCTCSVEPACIAGFESTFACAELHI
jgi:hypothetical protein